SLFVSKLFWFNKQKICAQTQPLIPTALKIYSLPPRKKIMRKLACMQKMRFALINKALFRIFLCLTLANCFICFYISVFVTLYEKYLSIIFIATPEGIALKA